MNAGDLVTPNIRLTRLLGEGGMGSVWVAEHLTLQTDVVVKFIQGTHASNAEVVSRFRREAALAAQARSPHVVQVFDHGISPHGTPFIAMEYLHGEDLGGYLEREGVAPVTTYADWLRQIAKGLTRTHAQGIIHRDIKPENLFLCETDGEITVKLLDFGVAKADPSSGFATTTTGAVVGTVYYMSPEQALGSSTIDFRTDLWALGVVSYLALTGNRPFTGSSILQLLSAITSGKFRPPSHWRPELGPEVDAWMVRVLSTDPSHRYPSAKAMAEAFVAAVQRTHGPLKVLSDSQPEPIQPLADVFSDRTLAASSTPASPGSVPAKSEVSPPGSRRAWWFVGGIAALTVVGFVAQRASNDSSTEAETVSSSELLGKGEPAATEARTVTRTVTDGASPAVTAADGASLPAPSLTLPDAAMSVAGSVPPSVPSAPANVSRARSLLTTSQPSVATSLKAPLQPNAVSPVGAASIAGAAAAARAEPQPPPAPAPKSPLQMNLE